MKFILNIEPIPQARTRWGNGKCYEPARLREYKDKLKKQVQTAGAKILTGAVEVSIKLYRKFKTTSRRFGDFDNLAKAICDSLNGVCYADDSQIVKCTVEKIQSTKPKIEVEIEQAT